MALVCGTGDNGGFGLGPDEQGEKGKPEMHTWYARIIIYISMRADRDFGDCGHAGSKKELKMESLERRVQGLRISFVGGCIR